MKVRVIKKGDYYYPQYKVLFHWNCFKKLLVTGWPRYRSFKSKVKTNTEEEAVSFFKNLRNIVVYKDEI